MIWYIYKCTRYILSVIYRDLGHEMGVVSPNGRGKAKITLVGVIIQQPERLHACKTSQTIHSNPSVYAYSL